MLPLPLFPLLCLTHMLLPCISLSHAISSHLLLRHSSSALKQALIHQTHFIPAQFSVVRYLPSCHEERPGSSWAFPSGMFTPSPSALTSPLIPRATSCPRLPALSSPAPCAGMSSVHPQSHQPFGALGELFLPLGFSRQTGDALSRAAPAPRPETGVWFVFFLPSSCQGPKISVSPATKVISFSWRTEVSKSYPLLPPSCCKSAQTSGPRCFWMPPATVGDTLCRAPVAAARENN